MTVNNILTNQQPAVPGIGRYFDDKKLSQDTGNLKNIKTVWMQKFLKNTPMLLNDLNRSVEKGQSRRTRKTLNALKSSIEYLCVDSLSLEIQALEIRTLLVATSQYINRISRLTASIERLMKEVQKVASV